MKRIIRLTERDLTRIVRRVINEESNDLDKMVDYVKSQWKVKDMEQNSSFTEIWNTEGSSIKFDTQNQLISIWTRIELDKLDPSPISLKSSLSTFKSWFDKNR